MNRDGSGETRSRTGRRGRNQVSYERPMPKFLRDMLKEEPQDPLAAKRETATHHLGKDAEDKRPTKKERDTDVDLKEIEALQKQGFNVVVPDDAAKEDQDVKKSKPLPTQRTSDAFKRARITKKSSRPRKRVVPTSRDKDRKRLSFAADYDSSDDSGNE